MPLELVTHQDFLVPAFQQRDIHGILDPWPDLLDGHDFKAFHHRVRDSKSSCFLSRPSAYLCKRILRFRAIWHIPTLRRRARCTDRIQQARRLWNAQSTLLILTWIPLRTLRYVEIQGNTRCWTRFCLGEKPKGYDFSRKSEAGWKSSNLSQL